MSQSAPLYSEGLCPYASPKSVCMFACWSFWPNKFKRYGIRRSIFCDCTNLSITYSSKDAYVCFTLLPKFCLTWLLPLPPHPRAPPLPPPLHVLVLCRRNPCKTCQIECNPLRAQLRGRVGGPSLGWHCRSTSGQKRKSGKILGRR